MLKTYSIALVLFLSPQVPAEARDYTQHFNCQSNLNGTVFDATWFMARKPQNAPKDAIHAKYKAAQDFLAIQFAGERSFTYETGVSIGFRLGTQDSFELKVNQKKSTYLFKRIGASSYCTTVGEIEDQGPPIR